MKTLVRHDFAPSKKLITRDDVIATPKKQRRTSRAEPDETGDDLPFAVFIFFLLRRESADREGESIRFSLRYRETQPKMSVSSRAIDGPSSRSGCGKYSSPQGRESCLLRPAADLTIARE